MAKAKAGRHCSGLETIWVGHHIAYQIDELSEISEAEIVRKLRASGGAHQPTGFDFGQGDVGEGAEAEAEAEEAPAVNARDAAPDCVKALTPEQEAAAREKQYQTPIGMPGGDGPGQAA